MGFRAANFGLPRSGHNIFSRPVYGFLLCPRYLFNNSFNFTEIPRHLLTANRRSQRHAIDRQTDGHQRSFYNVPFPMGTEA